VTTLLLFEFRQSVRLQVYLHRQDPSKGYEPRQGEQMLAHLQTDIDGGLVKVIPADWTRVHSRAERLSVRYTARSGYRALDILHVATALELGVPEFLSFDARQRALARAAGLKIKV
jgi:hypothetical protein